MRFALIGNQNCGKTTLFNQLTGSRQHVGNFPGVTVQKKEGKIRSLASAWIVDLPGIYSLSPYSSEELVSRDYLFDETPDAIVNIVDATNLERNLYLTLQLLELGLPMVVALNMMDDVRASGGEIDCEGLAEKLHVPVLPISASRGEGMDALLQAMDSAARRGERTQPVEFRSRELKAALDRLDQLLGLKIARAGYPKRFALIKVLEGDPPMKHRLRLTMREQDEAAKVVARLEREAGMSVEEELACARYAVIDELVSRFLKKPRETGSKRRTRVLDAVFTHRLFAIPIFFAVMLGVFYLTFGPVGTAVGDMFQSWIAAATAAFQTALQASSVSPWLQSLLLDGIMNGIGSVLSFLPTILILFLLLSLLEDSGYLARVAFVMDGLFRKLGLSGRSIVPMLIGFGCSVPAIMATRTLASDRDRKMTILLTPFMSCSAKLPIYAAFTAAFFPGNKVWVMSALYLMGILAAVLSALLFKNTLFRGDSVPFLLELPAYRFPTPKSVLLHMFDKAKDFLKRAFTIILMASVVIWFLQTFDWNLRMVSDNTHSIMASVGTLASPLFEPLGFGDWRVSTALITGLSAKETVLSTLSVLLKTPGAAALPALNALFTPLTACAFLVFTLLYMPCVAALAVAKRELGSIKGAVFAMTYQTGVAWLAAFIVFQLGRSLGFA